MILYLVRHGKAEDGDKDDLRRLTPGGQKAVARVAQTLSSGAVRPARIQHSGLVRARQTAEIIAAAVDAPLEAVEGLSPLAPVEPTARRLVATRDESILLVGHLPFMGRLASHLLTGDSDAELLHFRTASVACLALGEGGWQLEWFLAPKLA